MLMTIVVYPNNTVYFLIKENILLIPMNYVLYFVVHVRKLSPWEVLQPGDRML